MKIFYRVRPLNQEQIIYYDTPLSYWGEIFRIRPGPLRSSLAHRAARVRRQSQRLSEDQRLSRHPRVNCYRGNWAF